MYERRMPFWQMILLYFGIGVAVVIVHNLLMGDVDGSSWAAGIIAYALAKIIEETLR